MSEEAKQTEKAKEVKADKKTSKIAVVRVRGSVRVGGKVEDTMQMLKLFKKNYCVIISKTESNLGMVKKAKDYITWGNVSPEVEKMLIEKRGEKDPKDPKKLKKVFRLAPPRGGFERKGIKKPFNLGGALGDRGEKINDLLKKMI